MLIGGGNIKDIVLKAIIGTCSNGSHKIRRSSLQERLGIEHMDFTEILIELEKEDIISIETIKPELGKWYDMIYLNKEYRL